MRPIKFRAWNKDWGMMLPVDTLSFNNGEPFAVTVTVKASDYDHTGEWEDYEIGKDIILMQFTGLKDRNGTEIYEGDRFSVDSEKTGTRIGITTVVWDKDQARWRLKDTLNSGEFNLFWFSENCEVIGNVYENPELIK